MKPLIHPLVELHIRITLDFITTSPFPRVLPRDGSSAEGRNGGAV